MNYIYIGFTTFKIFLEGNLRIFLYFLEFYSMNSNEFIDFSKEIEVELHNLTNTQLNKKFKEISSFVTEIFRKKFWNDEKGVPRIWNRIEENQIDDLYKKYKDEVIYNYNNSVSVMKCSNYSRALNLSNAQ